MNLLSRLFLIITLLCGFSGIEPNVWAKNYTETGKQDNEEQIKQSDGWLSQMAEEPQTSTGTIVLSVPSSSRIASFCTIRLLPTHGGKSNNHTSRWAKGNSNNNLSSPTTLSFRCRCWQCVTAASPRLRYIIALRRLLC